MENKNLSIFLMLAMIVFLLFLCLSSTKTKQIVCNKSDNICRVEITEALGGKKNVLEEFSIFDIKGSYCTKIKQQINSYRRSHYRNRSPRYRYDCGIQLENKKIQALKYNDAEVGRKEIDERINQLKELDSDKDFVFIQKLQ